MGLIYDLEVRKDVKGGSPKTPPRGTAQAQFGTQAPRQAAQPHNGRHIQIPSLTNVLQILQIIVIAMIALSWWTKRESGSDVSIATQNLAITAISKRLDTGEARAEKALEKANVNEQELHELMVKFRIMVELVDGKQEKPELRK